MMPVLIDFVTSQVLKILAELCRENCRTNFHYHEEKTHHNYDDYDEHLLDIASNERSTTESQPNVNNHVVVNPTDDVPYTGNPYSSVRYDVPNIVERKLVVASTTVQTNMNLTTKYAFAPLKLPHRSSTAATTTLGDAFNADADRRRN